MQLTELVDALNAVLEPEAHRDYCPNGLQVEGKAQVGKIISGVTASAALIEKAIEAKADAILVHHGYFWKDEPEPVTGMKKRRLKQLLDNDISLIAYHLPLDAHGELGNNAQLARVLDLEIRGTLDAEKLVWHGVLPEPMPPEKFAEFISDRLKRKPLHIGKGKAPLQTVAWCTGAAQNYLEHACRAGLDAYITGEISEPTVHIANETGIHFYSAGHHATERYGVHALGEYIAKKCGLEHEFIDIENPV